MTERKVKIRRRILYIAGIALMFSTVFSGCKKDDEFIPDPGNLASVTPANNGTIDPSGTLDLKWSGQEAIKYNVYFGEKPIPELYQNAVTSQSLNVPVAGGHTYYWQIGTIDGNGKESLSAVYTFRVKMLIDLDKFNGLFDCDEPRYTHYDVNFTKAGKDTIQNDNFWDLDWKLKYVLDDMGKVKIVPATFSPDPSLKVSVSGTGTFDNEKKELVVTYVVLQDASAGSPLAIEIDKNTHTFVKK
ncbi:MAG TPA: hypothetical protein VHO46_12895 [Bacteroidales bacterium]|nr:hypothetical protein [Bacteroidales bacterium]